MTIMLVEKGTLAQYRYLEHGAFNAIIALSVTMFLQSFLQIPKVITPLGGAVLTVSPRRALRLPTSI